VVHYDWRRKIVTRAHPASSLKFRAADLDAMALALREAENALPYGDVPVGAVVIDEDGLPVAAACNRRERDHDPTAHAEVLALRAAAAKRGTWRLAGCTLAVTLEPCPMCAGAVVLSRVTRLVIGADDPKAGAVGSVWDLVRDPRQNHQAEVVVGVRAAESSQLLRRFFAKRRHGAGL